MKFSYSDVNYESFSKQYKSDGLIERKFIAIPSTLICGIVKTIYHLCKAVLLGIPRACLGEGKYFKADIFRIGRDFEESLGWFVTFFNDKAGSYLVQESLFHKECYSFYENLVKAPIAESNKPTSNIPQNSTRKIGAQQQTNNPPTGQTNNSSAATTEQNNKPSSTNPTSQNQTSKADETQTQSTEKKEVPNLTKKTPSLPSNIISFVYADNKSLSKVVVNFMSLNKASALRDITLYDLKIMDKEKQQEAIEVLEIKDHLSKNKIEIDLFLKYLNETNDNLLVMIKLFDLTRPLKDSCIKFAFVSDEKFKTLPLNVIKNASIEQINIVAKRLELSNTAAPQIDSDQKILDVPLINFHHITGEKISAVIDQIPANIFLLISDKQLKEMDISKASEEQIKRIFYEKYEDEKNKNRFAILTTPQVQSILGKLDEDTIKFVSEKQLPDLDLKGLDARKLRCLLKTSLDAAENNKRFALLSVPQVQGILHTLDQYMLEYVSDKQLSELDLSGLDIKKLECLLKSSFDSKKNKERFAVLTVPQVKSIFKELHKIMLTLVSDKQLPELDLSGLDAEKIKYLIHSSYNTKDNKKRFALLTPMQVKSIHKKLDKNMLSFVTEKQKEELKKLDLQTVSAQS